MSAGVRIAVFFPLLISMISCTQYEKAEFIAINQVGYPLEGEKQAFLVNGLTNHFELVRAEDHKVVFMKMADRRQESDLASGDYITLLDFSEFKEAGSYFIRITSPKYYESEIFMIGENPYLKASLTAIQSYYYHRCGSAVDNGSPWKHERCHIEDAPFYNREEKKMDVTGGWHDAGDYNKFSVNTSYSTALLLYLYESDPTVFQDGQLSIPEAENGIPDILDETRWALEWLLKMQDSGGGVYHKVSQKKWIGEFLPAADPSTRYIFEVSSAATASFAATTALAARMYEAYDPVFAKLLIQSSLKAWGYLENHPLNVPLGGFKNPPDVRGGEYGDTQDDEERMWAALELYRTTGNEQFLKYNIDNYWKLSGSRINPLSWRNAEVLVLSILAKTDTNGNYERQKESARKQLVRHADEILGVYYKNHYKNLNRHTEYYWGSNSVGLSYAFALIQGYELTGREEYYRAAMDQLHFVLGRNPVNRSQVTGVGKRSVAHPYHQFSELDGVKLPVPGMMVGGPNNHLLLDDREISPYPAKNYQDAFKNYLVNEPAVNYTAIFAFVSGYLSLESPKNTFITNRHDTLSP